MPIFHLVYRSVAADKLTQRDLEDILIISRTLNAQHRITGVLIYRDRSFLQLLEGDEKAVRDTLERIRRDRRNHDVQVLAEAVSDARLLQDWSMGWVDGDAAGPSAAELFELFDQTRQGRVLETREAISAIVRRFAVSSRQLIQ